MTYTRADRPTISTFGRLKLADRRRAVGGAVRLWRYRARRCRKRVFCNLSRRHAFISRAAIPRKGPVKTAARTARPPAIHYGGAALACDSRAITCVIMTVKGAQARVSRSPTRVIWGSGGLISRTTVCPNCGPPLKNCSAGEGLALRREKTSGRPLRALIFSSTRLLSICFATAIIFSGPLPALPAARLAGVHPVRLAATAAVISRRDCGSAKTPRRGLTATRVTATLI